MNRHRLSRVTRRVTLSPSRATLRGMTPRGVHRESTSLDDLEHPATAEDVANQSFSDRLLVGPLQEGDQPFGS